MQGILKEIYDYKVDLINHLKAKETQKSLESKILNSKKSRGFINAKLPLAVVYATWCGLGIFTVAILGYLIYGQTLSWQVILGLFFIIIGLTLVNLYSSKVIN